MEKRTVIILLLCLVSADLCCVTGWYSARPPGLLRPGADNNGSRTRDHPDFRHCHDYRNS